MADPLSIEALRQVVATPDGAAVDIDALPAADCTGFVVRCARELLVAREALTKPREFAIVPIDSDQGEMEALDATVSVRVTDLSDGIVAVLLPSSLLDEQVREVRKALDDARAATRGSPLFLVFVGPLDHIEWLRLVPRDRYDEDFAEERPSR